MHLTSVFVFIFTQWLSHKPRKLTRKKSLTVAFNVSYGFRHLFIM